MHSDSPWQNEREDNQYARNDWSWDAQSTNLQRRMLRYMGWVHGLIGGINVEICK